MKGANKWFKREGTKKRRGQKIKGEEAKNQRGTNNVAVSRGGVRSGEKGRRYQGWRKNMGLSCEKGDEDTKCRGTKAMVKKAKAKK